MINQVYLGITVSALLLINIIDYKAYKYIKANYKGNANYNSSISEIKKDFLRNIVKSIIPIYNFLILVGAITLVVEESEKIVEYMGFDKEHCIFK